VWYYENIEFANFESRFHMDRTFHVDSTLNAEQQYFVTTCAPIWSSSFANWILTELATGAVFTSLQTDLGGDVETQITKRDFPFTATSPCCSSCTFTAGSFQVYHWPQVTAVPSISKLVNAYGFTL